MVCQWNFCIFKIIVWNNHLLSEAVCFSDVCSDEPVLVFFSMLINNCALLRRSNWTWRRRDDVVDFASSSSLWTEIKQKWRTERWKAGFKYNHQQHHYKITPLPLALPCTRPTPSQLSVPCTIISSSTNTTKPLPLYHTLHHQYHQAQPCKITYPTSQGN